MTVPFLFMAIFGSDATTGAVIGGITVPAVYLVVTAICLISGARLFVLRRLVPAAAPPMPKGRVVALLPLPVLAFAGLGMIVGNDVGSVRQDGFLILPMVAMAATVLFSLRRRDLMAAATWLVVAGLLAASKAILVGSAGDVTGRTTGLYSFVNPQFQVQRIIVNGGDMILAVAIPLAVGMLRTARGLRALFFTVSLPIMVFGLTLSYTRTLLGGVAIGIVVAVGLAVGGQRRQGVLSLQLLSALLGTAFLFTLTVGQSQFSVGAAAFRRLTGGSDVGSSQLSLRWADAVAAIGHGDIATLLGGRGLGAMFHSPITSSLPVTGYVHMGWAWLILKGGLPLLLLTLFAALTPIRPLRQVARRGSADAAAAVGLIAAIACFTSLNLVINTFATVEGTTFMGTMLGIMIVMSEGALMRANTRLTPVQAFKPHSPRSADLSPRATELVRARPRSPSPP
ncbi:hypothetical protein [Candidatus Aeolococcus gillhamiae]|uniref:hypothetical protein n=1 Tax=Candidatus Aeolococcus gillhamiae TaxID=3127015 RepID=UPI003076CA6F